MIASRLDGSYPRPQLVRNRWADLGGEWEFAYDDEDTGATGDWQHSSRPFDHRIQVPFPPESTRSGIADTGFHPVVWYRRTVDVDVLNSAGWREQGDQVLLHFGAVDYRADVWVDGQNVGSHEGGHTPFTIDITSQIAASDGDWVIVVRAADDPHDVAQPRGKQDWEEHPHGIWYHRTTGIWQPVWLEAVPATRAERLQWIPDLVTGSVQLRLELARRPAGPATVTVRLHYEDQLLAAVQFSQEEPRSATSISIPRQANGQAYERLLWSPEHPRLVDASVTIAESDGAPDVIASYFGLRSAGWADRHFMLNDRPYYVRAVLEQGYWPDTHLAAPSSEALRAEVQLAKDFGFNTVRVHEKVEDPRYLYWADRLGLLVWGEMPSAYEFSAAAIERTTREWTAVIARDLSHPCIVTWVPLNESWGVQHVSHDPAQLDYTRALYHLTKALDPTRPVISNDGWEHADSDIWTIHDYGPGGSDLAANYSDQRTTTELLAGIGPLGRRMRLLDPPDRGQPVIVSEFGGISYAPADNDHAWGYQNAQHDEEFEQLLRDQFEALQHSPTLAGFCYTQLTDTLQEANGLTNPGRQPKIAVSTIRSIVLGEKIDISTHRRPKKPVEKPTPPAQQDHVSNDHPAEDQLQPTV